MALIIAWLEKAFRIFPLPLLEMWGRVSFIIGIVLAVAAFGGFTFRPGGRWSLGRERQSWDIKAFTGLTVSFALIILAGYVGSFVVLVPGAQTLEILKDIVVFLSILYFGYPALLVTPLAYGISDVIEGVPLGSIGAWFLGYFINPAFFWIGYQLIGKNPDFRIRKTWNGYLLFVLFFMIFESLPYSELVIPRGLKKFSSTYCG